jgi:hypothetical protein
MGPARGWASWDFRQIIKLPPFFLHDTPLTRLEQEKNKYTLEEPKVEVCQGVTLACDLSTGEAQAGGS